MTQNPRPSDPTCRVAAQFNKTLQRTGAWRCDFMSYWFYNILGFGRGALSAPVAELGR
jgi:hypothetical protein